MLEGWQKRLRATVRQIDEAFPQGNRSLVLYDISIPVRPVTFPGQLGTWLIKFDTRGLGPSDWIQVSDDDSGWEDGITQTLPANASETSFGDQGKDPQELFALTSLQATEAIRDGSFTVIVNLSNQRLGAYAVSESIWVTLR